MSSLVILAASVFETWCGYTDKHTNGGENPAPLATAVGVGKNNYSRLRFNQVVCKDIH